MPKGIPSRIPAGDPPADGGLPLAELARTNPIANAIREVVFDPPTPPAAPSPAGPKP